MRLLCVSALVIACTSCGDERSRSASGNSADRERPTETLGARLSRLAGPREAEGRLVPLREVASSPAIVGRRVRVAGHCGFPISLRVPEPPANGGEAWLLEADGTTMLVVGARPSACSEASRRSTMLTLTVVVAEDTLAAIGDLPGAPRRYLLVVDTK
jgi:hypothetical protein